MVKPCVVITPTEYQEDYASQPEGQVFCNRCVEAGRNGFERHVRERRGQPCSCCRRAYQKNYYGGKPTKAAENKLAAQVEAMQKQEAYVQMLYNTADPDIHASIKREDLPRLHAMQRALGVEPTPLSLFRLTFLRKLFSEYPDLKERLSKRYVEQTPIDTILQALGTEAQKDEQEARRIQKANKVAEVDPSAMTEEERRAYADAEFEKAFGFKPKGEAD
jgi:hypothetical protein